MTIDVIKHIVDFFNRIPRLKPNKEGTLIMGIENDYYKLEYKNKYINVIKIGSTKINAPCILKISKKSFKKLFSSSNIEDFYNNLLDIVLFSHDIELILSENTNPMKNVFFKIFCIL
ncbi:MAG: hypothetical protein ACTSRP_22515 [Candidatus Helarchaeota archaeon]